MKEFLKLIKNSGKMEKFNLIISLIGIVTCLLPPVNLIASLLWVVIISQDLHIMSLIQFNKDLLDENSKLWTLVENRENKNE